MTLKAAALDAAVSATQAAEEAAAALTAAEAGATLAQRVGEAVQGKLSKLTKLADIANRWESHAAAYERGHEKGKHCGAMGREAFVTSVDDELHGADADEAGALFDALLAELGPAEGMTGRVEVKAALKRMTDDAGSRRKQREELAKTSAALHTAAYESQQAANGMEVEESAAEAPAATLSA
jgi:hypothetical protein